MKYYEYSFYCKKVPSRLTIHSILTLFLGKDDLSEFNFKSVINGKIVKITTDYEFNGSFSVTLTNERGQEFDCQLCKTENFEVTEFKKNDEVIISGLVSYAVNQKHTGKKFCPFFNGKFENKHLKDMFKNHIENTLGVKIESMTRESFSRLASEILSDKIQLNNTITMDLPVKVVDTEKCNTRQYKSFFQRKSYGFGGLDIISL